jgi:hypothetical protein
MIFKPPEYSSLKEVIKNHSEDARELLENALEQVHEVTGALLPIVKRGISIGYKQSGGRFMDDINAWASALGVSVADVITANVSYELFQAGQYLAELFPGLIGCTSVVTEVPGLGLAHIRNLDWELKGMGRTTVTTHFGDVVAITNPGFVGIYSGMSISKKFSITLNWAPPSERPRFDWGPAFLIREVLVNAVDFDEAVEYLSGTPLSTPALFMICGTNNACVIERTCQESAIRWYNGKNPLVVTNHYMTQEFKHLNDVEIFEDSKYRYKEALRTARRFKDKTLKNTLKILSGESCLNDLTVQQMVFAPTKAKYVARAFSDH